MRLLLWTRLLQDSVADVTRSGDIARHYCSGKDGDRHHHLPSNYLHGVPPSSDKRMIAWLLLDFDADSPLSSCYRSVLEQSSTFEHASFVGDSSQ